MVIKLVRAAAVLLAFGSFALMPVSAGQIKPHAKIFLKCTFVEGGGSSKVIVQNTTNSTIPSGTTIHWSLCSGYLAKTDSNTLTSALPKGQIVSFERGSSSCNPPYTPKAWYWK